MKNKRRIYLGDASRAYATKFLIQVRAFRTLYWEESNKE